MYQFKLVIPVRRRWTSTINHAAKGEFDSLDLSTIKRDPELTDHSLKSEITSHTLVANKSNKGVCKERARWHANAVVSPADAARLPVTAF